MKTLPDFLASIKNGRFFRQSYNVTNREKPYIIILEGSKDSVVNSGMKREAVQGALMHIAIFLGIPVLRSVDVKETLQLIVQAARQIQDYEESFYYRVYPKAPKVKKSMAEKLKLQILQNLPGIGHERAQAILKEYGSLQKVFSTKEKRLLKVEGVGKKTANEILKLIN